MKYEEEASGVLNQTNLDDIIGRECRDLKARIEKIEATRLPPGFREFLRDKQMRKEAERKVAERQAWIIVEKVTEMEAEKRVCEMMIESM